MILGLIAHNKLFAGLAECCIHPRLVHVPHAIRQVAHAPVKADGRRVYIQHGQPGPGVLRKFFARKIQQLCANAAAAVANGLIADTETELATLRGLLSEVRTATKTAQDAYDLVSKINGVDVFAGIPATLVVEETINAVVGSSPIIAKELFPRTANQSVIFQLSSGKGSVTPDGVVSSPTEAGNMVINVISTISSALWKQVTVKFRTLQARTTENGIARTAEDGTAIEC